jgi:flagellar basal-body rod protein FlgF
MDVSSYVLLSHEQALRRRLDVAANNMANMSTSGFKREQPLFREHVERAPAALVDAARPTSFVLDRGAVHDTAAGAFVPTANPLDLMIEGPGYLAVEGGDGETLYTRAGALLLSETGELVTANGRRVLGEGGAPVSVPLESQATLSIGPDGTVSTADGEFGRIAVTVFDDERALEPGGDGLFTATVPGRELEAGATRVRSGGVEGSNVQPIAETTSMVEILRAYQSSMRMSEALNDMRRAAIEKLGRAE